MSKRRGQKGGASHYGYTDSGDEILDVIATNWWEHQQRMVWWSDGQDGYYFSSLQNRYMSPTHTHIYRTELEGEGEDSRIKLYWSRKVEGYTIANGISYVNSLQEAINEIYRLNQVMEQWQFN
jgi:hypothetical protein